MIRIAFLGLGGVGGYFAGKLSRAFAQSEDVEIICLARNKTAAVICENGIRLITPGEEFVSHPHLVVTPGEDCPAIDFLVCAVKSYDLEESMEQFRSCVSDQTIILPLLNGIDAEEKVRQIFPRNEIWNGCVYIVSRLTSPGVITETGNIHRLHFGGADTEKTQLLYRILKQAHDDVFLHENIRDILWEKFIFISPLASLTSYLDVCIGKILEHHANRQQLMHLLEEICAVARAENIPLPEDIVSTTLAKMGKLPYDTTSSMHSDFQKRSPTEYRSLTAHIVKMADKHAIEVPVYAKILEGLEIRSRFSIS
jgi:2-dehydropantoate 2-reductase